MQSEDKQRQAHDRNPRDECHLDPVPVGVPALLVRHDSAYFGDGALQVKLLVDAQTDQSHEQNSPEPLLVFLDPRVRVLPGAKQPPYKPCRNGIQQHGQPPANGRIPDAR